MSDVTLVSKVRKLWTFRFSRFLARLGPGLITGASDDDPSGIGTYSQAGAQLGFGVGWTTRRVLHRDRCIFPSVELSPQTRRRARRPATLDEHPAI
jgi:hypothetical protein